MSSERELLLDEEDHWDDEEDTLENRFLTFRIENQEYGIEIRHVTEIVGVQRITEVPDMPGFVKGVINLRGHVIPVMDVRSRFKMDTREYDDRTCVIVTRINELSVGLIVDTVKEVMDIPEANVSPPPSIGNDANQRYILGMARVGEDVKILLDVNKLLFEKELEQLMTK